MKIESYKLVSDVFNFQVASVAGPQARVQKAPPALDAPSASGGSPAGGLREAGRG